MCSTNTRICHDKNALSNNLHNNLFLPGFSSSPGWLLVTRTRGAWWCRYLRHWRSGPRYLTPRSRVCAQEWHRKDIHSHNHSITHSMHTPKKSNKKLFLFKRLNLPNMMPSFTGQLPVQRGGGRRSGSLALASQDCSTSETFSPRTVLTDNICTCVQQILQYVTTKMPFLTTSTITYSCLALVAPQADSWWLGHVVPDDVVIADIGGQALDILLHGPESAHKNGIVKTFIHTSIPLHTPCTLLKTSNKKWIKKSGSTYQTWCLPLLVLFLSIVVVGDGQEAWYLLLRTAPRRRPSRLEQYWQKTFVAMFNKYSNISRQKCPF